MRQLEIPAEVEDHTLREPGITFPPSSLSPLYLNLMIAI